METADDMSTDALDLLIINPGGREGTYQALGETLTAIEPPLWCRLIAGYVRDRGHSVAIVDAEAENWDGEHVAAEVGRLAPSLVCIVAAGHQPSASTQQMTAAGDACWEIKTRIPETPIVIVGGHASALPERTLAEEVVDFVCVGEGPVTIKGLLDWTKAGAVVGALAEIPGLVFWQDGRMRVTPRAPLITDLDGELHGDVWDLLPMEKYRAHNWHCFDNPKSRTPYASIYTSLGCPYSCNFCCINATFGTNRYRMRTPENVVAEIEQLHDRYGIKTIKIVDEMFVLNERHVGAICDLLIESELDLNIWAYARVDTVKPHMLARLRQAGIRWLAFGIESGSDHVRDGAAKSFAQDDIVDTVRAIQAAGISVIGNFIFGLPDDTRETMRNTLDLAIELNCEFANFYAAMAYPGSPLYTQALEQGLALLASWNGFSQHSYDATPLPTQTLSSADVLRFRDAAFREYFLSRRYLDMIEARFGEPTRRHVEAMADHRAGSTGRRNTFSLTGLQALVQSFGRSSPSEGLAGPCIERVSNNCEYVRTVCAQIGSFREVLSKQSIGVLVRSALPRAVRFAEVDGKAGCDPQIRMPGHLCSLVPGQRVAKLRWQCRDRPGDGIANRFSPMTGKRRPVLHARDGAVAFHSGKMQQHCEPRGAFHQSADRRSAQADDQVTFPVSGYGPISCFRRSFTDHDLRRDEGFSPPAATCPRYAQCPSRAKAGGQLTTECAAALYVERLIDRLMTDPHRLILGPVPRIVDPKTVRDLLRTPGPSPSPVLPRPMPTTVPDDAWPLDHRSIRCRDPTRKPILHIAPQRLIRCQLGWLRPFGGPISMPLRRRCSVVQATASGRRVAPHLAGDRRRCSLQPASNMTYASSLGAQKSNLLTFLERQVTS